MINFLGVGFSVLIKGVLFWKMKNIGTVSYPEVISRSFQPHFVKYHKKDPLSQTLVCCYIVALLILDTVIYFFYPALFWLVENIFGLIFTWLILLFILYMDVISYVKSVMKVGFRGQINYMEFMKVCMRFSSAKTVS